MLSDKKAGPFKVEIACIKVVNPPGQAPTESDDIARSVSRHET